MIQKKIFHAKCSEILLEQPCSGDSASGDGKDHQAEARSDGLGPCSVFVGSTHVSWTMTECGAGCLYLKCLSTFLPRDEVEKWGSLTSFPEMGSRGRAKAPRWMGNVSMKCTKSN